ncbi:response regulator [Methylorubrum suomiense]|uniref:Sensor histidine kinase RcsC n=1 Tax=Methylorubrum suomiense TaxID=144191 RepID=A0ABQ4V2I2_9HYPH|nr:response regulator [Methylorubrum suomiense]GJE78591.1 Sensor histidine kinase RcsC [Methylorubrum suomiense]
MHAPVKKPVVVVAEDDPIAMRIVAAELSSAGYQAVTCSDGITALEYVAHGERLDALITDVYMPGSIDGFFLAAEVRSLRPRLPIIYLSGKSMEARHMVAGSRFLEKPFEVGQLAILMRAVMCGAVANLMAETWSLRLETERKFLVRNDAWRALAAGSRRLSDGLIGAAGGMKVRVRKDGTRAWLTVKGPRTGISRMEFECEISVRQADALLASVLDDNRIEKLRHSVPHGGLTWTVDVYGGDLDGYVTAEVELTREDQDLALPDWVGREVTGDPRFSQGALRRMNWKAV